MFAYICGERDMLQASKLVGVSSLPTLWVWRVDLRSLGLLASDFTYWERLILRCLFWNCAKKRFLSCFSFCVYWVYMCGIPDLTFQVISLVTWQTTYWLKWDISIEPRTCYLGYLIYLPCSGDSAVSPFLPTAGIMPRLPCQSPRTRVLDIWTPILAFM